MVGTSYMIIIMYLNIPIIIVLYTTVYIPLYNSTPTDKATADSGSVQFFAIIKNTGHGNFVIGRFHTRARNGLSVLD